MNTQQSDLIKMLSLNNIIPILVTFITAVIFTVNLGSRIDLLNQKVDLVLQNQNTTLLGMQQKDAELQNDYLKMQGQWGDLSQRVTRLER